MLMHDQHLYKNPTIEVYGHCRLLLPWLRVPCWFFLQSRVEKWVAGWLGIEPATTDLSSQLGFSSIPWPTSPHFYNWKSNYLTEYPVLYQISKIIKMIDQSTTQKPSKQRIGRVDFNPQFGQITSIINS